MRKDDKKIHKKYTPTAHFWADSSISISARTGQKIGIFKTDLSYYFMVKEKKSDDFPKYT
jgi:hypothetical protein